MMQELVSWIWWLSVVSTLFYVVFFAVGPGSIPWMIAGEMFTQVCTALHFAAVQNCSAGTPAGRL